MLGYLSVFLKSHDLFLVDLSETVLSVLVVIKPMFLSPPFVFAGTYDNFTTEENIPQIQISQRLLLLPI